MRYKLSELAKQLDAPYSGNGDFEINHACGLINRDSGGIAFLADPAQLAALPTPEGVFSSKQLELQQFITTTNCAIIVPPDLKSDELNLIYAKDPLAAHVEAIHLLYPPLPTTSTVHSSATVSESASIGKNVTIDANVTIYDDVTIGDNTVIRSGSVVMNGSKIGSDCLIYPNVSIRENCEIGNRVILHANSVIGADGFGYFQRESENRKIPQIGNVIIEDDVEIGACSAVDRARFGSTIIRKGTKMDNLIHIAHNVEVGEQSLIAAQSGIAGSTKTGDRLMMGGQSGIRDNLTIGSRVTLLARTLITGKTGDGEIVAGMPSRSVEKWRKVQALIQGLDILVKRITKLEKRLK